MDFFERQRQVRGASKRLVVLFALAVLALTAMVNVVMVILISASDGETTPEDTVTLSVLVSGAMLLTIGGVSTVRTLMLRRGGGVKVAESLGGVRVPDLPSEPHLKRYRNIVEEIAIASSTPVPALYYLPDEAAINAFAAGYSPADAAVCVTQGSLDRLNRDELQGVIAHEFSHIVNGDMRLSLKLIGVLAGITAWWVIGRILLNVSRTMTFGGRSRGNNGALFALGFLATGLLLLAAGSIGVFFGRLIKAAVSRQREYLADASAVQFTRQTSGLTGALKKIGGLPAGSQLRSPKTENVNHMLFGAGLKLSSMYATHPPLIDRIRVLEPDFAAGSLDQLQRHWLAQPPDGLAEDTAMGLAPAPGPQAPLPAPDVREYPGAVGNPSAASYAAARRIHAAIPPHLVELARNPVTAMPLIYGLIFDRNPGIRRAQYDIVARQHGRPAADESWRRGAELARLDPALRLPIAAIAFPALRNRPEADAKRITSALRELINADGQIDIFEYCLGTLFFVNLSEALTPGPPWRSRRQTLAGAQNAVCLLLAVLAQSGNADPRAAAAAFHAGVSVAYPGARIPLTPTSGVLALEQVWPVIDGLEGNDKATLIAAVVATISADRVVTTAESELLRTVCGVLHCPVPPVG